MGRGQGSKTSHNASMRQFVHPVLLKEKDNPLLVNKRQILLDFDSTVWPMLDAIGDHRLGKGVDYPGMKEFDQLSKMLGKNTSTVFSDIMTFDYMRDYPPFSGIKHFTDAMNACNVKLHVLSDRASHLTDDVGKYLKQHGIKVDSFECISEVDKIQWAKEREIEVIIDDHPSTIEASLKAGLKPLSLTYAYNKTVIDQLKIKAADNWDDLNKLAQETLVEIMRG